MASWIGLAFLILLSANAVLSDTVYRDPLIDNDSYLSKCIISTATNMLTDGVKKIHSGSECYAKTKIQFKVQSDGSVFTSYIQQGDGLVAPAKIRYKFGDCFDTVVEIKKDDGGKVKYTIQKLNGGTEVVDTFAIFLKRNQGQAQGSDLIEVGTDSKSCNIFQKDGSENTPTLMDFEQEVLSGVPDLTLIWNVPWTNGAYFGTAYAKRVDPIVTTTSTTAMPTSVPKKAFPWWIIGVAVGGALVLLVILLVVGYLCWRHSRAQKPKQDEKTDRSTFGTTMQTVQEKSQNEPNVMYFEKAAQSAPIQAISPASQASPMQAAK